MLRGLVTTSTSTSGNLDSVIRALVYLSYLSICRSIDHREFGILNPAALTGSANSLVQPRGEARRRLDFVGRPLFDRNLAAPNQGSTRVRFMTVDHYIMRRRAIPPDIRFGGELSPPRRSIIFFHRSRVATVFTSKRPQWGHRNIPSSWSPASRPSDAARRDWLAILAGLERRVATEESQCAQPACSGDGTTNAITRTVSCSRLLHCKTSTSFHHQRAGH